MIRKNPIIGGLFITFILLNVVDAVTALFILPGEANPLYLLFNSIWIVWLVKLLYVILLGYYIGRNIYPNHFVYYMLVMILLLGSLVIGLGAYSNIQGILHKEAVVLASESTPQAKMEAYSWFVTTFYGLPMVIALLGFAIYEWSLKRTVIDREYFRKRKWWLP